MTHALKTIAPYFTDIKDGVKLFELRKFDRDFKVGDQLLLQEYNPVDKKYTGEEISVTITYILQNAEKFGLKKGYCILGFSESPF